MSKPISSPGRRRGNAGTREAIVAAARRQFAALGYDRASMRSIAREAGVDPALVKYFFETKPQLLVASMQLPFDPTTQFPQLLAGDRAHVGERLASFLLQILEAEETRRLFIGLIRAATTEPKAAAMLREIIESKLLTVIVTHLGSDQPALRASYLGTQLIGIVVSRYVTAVEPLASQSAEDVIRVVAPIFQRLLVEPL